ncbi:hypothetical protein evm_014408 [Chilo suppressalis]|nr:hypothetical protein evm_014408 [Chilo suppressalis]
MNILDQKNYCMFGTYKAFSSCDVCHFTLIKKYWVRTWRDITLQKTGVYHLTAWTIRERNLYPALNIEGTLERDYLR